MSQPQDAADDQPTDSTDGGPTFSSSNAAIVGLVIVALIAALAVVAVLVFRADEDDEVVSGGDQGGSTSLPAETTPPSEPEPSVPLGADSPLVGLTEAEVRERYALVRVVEIDGEPQMTTMDLQQGRINLAVEGDEVVGATVEGCDEITDDSPPWIRQACDPDPDNDGPSTFGKLLADPDGGDELTLEVGTQGDQYHQGMVIRPTSDETRVVLLDGTPITADELLPDDVVYVWAADECAESSPVQCDIHVILVDR